MIDWASVLSAAITAAITTLLGIVAVYFPWRWKEAARKESETKTREERDREDRAERLRGARTLTLELENQLKATQIEVVRQLSEQREADRKEIKDCRESEKALRAELTAKEIAVIAKEAAYITEKAELSRRISDQDIELRKLLRELPPTAPAVPAVLVQTPAVHVQAQTEPIVVPSEEPGS